MGSGWIGGRGERVERPSEKVGEWGFVQIGKKERFFTDADAGGDSGVGRLGGDASRAWFGQLFQGLAGTPGLPLLAVRSDGVVLSGGGRWRRGMLRESPMEGEQGRSARRRREATRDQLTSFQILRRLQQFGLSKRTALLQNASTSILLLSTAVVNGDPSRRPRRFT